MHKRKSRPAEPGGILYGTNLSLEADRGHPVPKSNKHFAEFSPYRLVEFEEVTVEDGSDETERDLIDEFHEGNESVEESENRRNRLVQVGPEVVVDNVKDNADNETGYNTFNKTLGKTLKPCDDGNSHLLHLFGGNELLEGKLRFRILLGVACGGGVGLLGVSSFELDILVFHVHSPLILKNVLVGLCHGLN